MDRSLVETLPPVSSGDRISATGAWVATACLMVRSAMNSNSSSRVMVWCSIASESSTGRMVRQTSAWPILNSPSVPRSETSMSSGIWNGTASEASTLASVAKPEVCISTMPRTSAHPGAGDDADGLFLARGGKGGEEGVGVQVLDQRRQHAVRHVGDQADIVPLQGLQDDAVPAPVAGRLVPAGRGLLFRKRHCVLP